MDERARRVLDTPPGCGRTSREGPTWQILRAAWTEGVGRVAGLGAEGDPTMQMSREQFEGGMSEVFKTIGMPDNVAALAAKGR